MKYIVFLLFTFIFYKSNAQKCYQGGKGDGYAMASFSFQSVGYPYNSIDQFDIIPSLINAGSAFIIPEIPENQTVLLININGESLEIVGNKRYYVPKELNAGIYVVRYRDHSVWHTSKLMIVN